MSRLTTHILDIAHEQLPVQLRRLPSDPSLMGFVVLRVQLTAPGANYHARLPASSWNDSTYRSNCP